MKFKTSTDKCEFPEANAERRNGWQLFTPEISWFIYDFFKYRLNGYEKLMFYSYYVNDFTLEEIAESADCSFQYIGVVIKKIEKKLRASWINKDSWRKPDDCERSD